MPAYQYEAANAAGKLEKGTLEAESPRAARAQLRSQGLVPLSVEPAAAAKSAGSLNITLWQKKRMSANGLTIWTRQLASLVAAGLPLERALTALSEDATSDEQHAMLADIRAEVNAGSPFGKALAKHPREFSALYCNVVSAGEHSGQLAEVLSRLAQDLEDQDALKSKLIAASLYPAIVSLAAVIIVLFLMSYVVPQLAEVFAGSKRQLPLITRIVLGISNGIRAYGLWIGLGTVLGAMGLWWMLRKAAIQAAFDAWWLKLPIVGRLAAGYNAARFGGTLAMLTGSGVPILGALQASANTLSNQSMKADALDVLVLVREGAPLGLALSQKKRFPSLLSMFARLGEQSGQLPAMLSRAAAQLSADVQRRALSLATILEPLLIIIMGIIVLIIVLAVMLPIIQMNTLVK